LTSTRSKAIAVMDGKWLQLKKRGGPQKIKLNAIGKMSRCTRIGSLKKGLKVKAMQSKKEKLFAEILHEAGERCWGCFECDENNCCLSPDCAVNDDMKTAILSLDKKENWPNLFKN
jgi:hypothetical protein